ncbi:OLC1v1029231C2 [Oldenlandia corymbosa var. corymbosa]|uniref:OLC1v1029231C2 n=1 Tax=Oldenlandia corymbosa var. corymbosa TaxID=529605 RepID=A0AAV1CDH9_OLDCO|nr:OLC1v1029231C2 [Oldenlandia corymbosa var. corymbosa]
MAQSKSNVACFCVQNVKDYTQADSQVPTISDRFMGLKAALVTNNSNLQCFGRKCGLTILSMNEITGSSHPLDQPFLGASGLLKVLGFQDGKTLDTSQFDLILVHMGAGEGPDGLVDIKQVNDLVGALVDMVKPETEISSRLHLSLIMSYGAVHGDGNSKSSLSVVKLDDNSKLSLLYPRQSYTLKAGKLRENVRCHSPMLIAQWQNAVTRRDLVGTFSFLNFKEHGGNLVIPADRFIHEVAFKLWKAPKYGA